MLYSSTLNSNFADTMKEENKPTSTGWTSMSLSGEIKQRKSYLMLTAFVAVDTHAGIYLKPRLENQQGSPTHPLPLH